MSSGIGGDMAVPAGIHLASGSVSAATDGELRIGQRVLARVLELLSSDDILFEFGLNRTVVHTSRSMQQGDRVLLEVVAGGVEPKFRLVADMTGERRQPTAVAIDRQGLPPALSARDLPVILRALADTWPTVVTLAGAGQEFLSTLPSDLGPDVVAQIQRLLAPLDAGLPPAALAAMIRTFFAQSGLFTENQLRGALESDTGALQGDQHHLAFDVRLLLGGLASDAQAVPDAVRSFGDALLQMQLAVAERLATTGVGAFVIPFMFGEERVDVAFEWERQARSERRDRPDHTISLGVFVRLPSLGAIEARVEWQPDSLAVTFYVEREATCAIVEAGLSDFSERLSLSGCTGVTVHVRLRPERTSSAPLPGRRTMPGGTILNVMA